MPALKSVFPGYAPMKPNTALSILLAAISLWLAASDGADDGISAAHRNSRSRRGGHRRADVSRICERLRSAHRSTVVRRHRPPVAALSRPNVGADGAVPGDVRHRDVVAAALGTVDQCRIRRALRAGHRHLSAGAGRLSLRRADALPAPAQHVDRYPYGGDPAHPHDRRHGDAAGCRFLCARQLALHRRHDRPADAAGGDCAATDPRLDRSSRACDRAVRRADRVRADRVCQHRGADCGRVVHLPAPGEHRYGAPGLRGLPCAPPKRCSPALPRTRRSRCT